MVMACHLCSLAALPASNFPAPPPPAQLPFGSHPILPAGPLQPTELSEEMRLVISNVSLGERLIKAIRHFQNCLEKRSAGLSMRTEGCRGCGQL